MRIFDRYVLKNLMVATGFVAATLAVVIFLTQSLRFLELVIESGASSHTFWALTLLAMPRFFEIILPLALMTATLFIYNRLTNDSELVAIRSAGYSPFCLARPALHLSLFAVLFLLVNTLWLAPRAISGLQEMRQLVKAQFSTALLREGVFNQLGQGLTVYIRDRGRDGMLHGLMIHDSRDAAAPPSTVVAKSGMLVATKEAYKILLNEGSRQEFDQEKGTLKRLNFSQYTIELPEGESVGPRWQEPDERTLYELLNPDMGLARDVESLRDFHVELHRRIVSPCFAFVFTVISCVFLLTGSLDRRGQVRRIATAVFLVVVIQGLYIAAYNLARRSDMGLILMWLLVLGPGAVSLFLLRGMNFNAFKLKNISGVEEAS